MRGPQPRPPRYDMLILAAVEKQHDAEQRYDELETVLIKERANARAREAAIRQERGSLQARITQAVAEQAKALTRHFEDERNDWKAERTALKTALREAQAQMRRCEARLEEVARREQQTFLTQGFVGQRPRRRAKGLIDGKNIPPCSRR